MISSFFDTPTLAVSIVNIEQGFEGKVIVFGVGNGVQGNLFGSPIEGCEFVQTEAMTRAGIAVHKYGAYIIPASAEETPISVTVKYGDSIYTANIENIAVGTCVVLVLKNSNTPEEGGGGQAGKPTE